jgi:hypothetical protein
MKRPTPMVSSGTSTTASPLLAPPNPTGSVGRKPYCCLPPPAPPFCDATVTVGQIDTHLKSSDLPNHLGRQQNFLRNRKKGFELTEKGLSSALPSSKGLGS